MPIFQGEVSEHIDAPPDEVYALVSDVTRMGEWSPETVSCEWVDGATGPAPGAKFKGRNARGWMKWSTTPEVVTAEPGREFAFRTSDTVWRYRLEPENGGTRVTESYEVERYNLLFKLVSPVKRRQPEMTEGMRTTLQRLKAVAGRVSG